MSEQRSGAVRLAAGPKLWAGGRQSCPAAMPCSSGLPALSACRDIKAIVEGPPAQLIESVAERIAERILAGHPLVTAVRVGVRKPHVAVSGVVQSLGVEVMRLRQH